MAKVLLPVQLNPISRRKDKSVKLSYETRELNAEETMLLMSMEGEEGWLMFSTNNNIKEEEIPQEDADLGGKTQSQRMKAVLYKLYIQDTESKIFVGSFESYYKDRMEKLLEMLKAKIKD